MWKKVVIGIGIIFLFIVLFWFFFYRKELTNCYPQISLKGDNIISLKAGEIYQEPGYEVTDSCKEDVRGRVVVENNITYDVPGTYEVIYTVDNSIGNIATAKRFVTIPVEKKIEYKDSYDHIDNEVHGWGVPSKKNGERPVEAGKVREQLLQYNAYLIGNDEKTLYLTFDEGENNTYVKEIIEVLNQNDVKGTFFFCKNYILKNPDIMKLLVETGHSVGNHTANHETMAQYANASQFQNYIREITAVEEAFYSVTGKKLDKVYREPRGEYSLRSLQIMKDLGYKTYFWSVAYVDFNGDVSKKTALTELTSRVHNGAIYLIHPKNKGNYEAMDIFIKNMKKAGYTFDLVKNIK